MERDDRRSFERLAFFVRCGEHLLKDVDLVVEKFVSASRRNRHASRPHTGGQAVRCRPDITSLRKFLRRPS